MQNNNARIASRVQCGNAQPARFLLTDVINNVSTTYCICTDLSETGARFFTDREFGVNQRLLLTVMCNDKQLEKVAVNVTRADSNLSDEERFCASVEFNQPLASFEKLAALFRKASSSMAA